MERVFRRLLLLPLISLLFLLPTSPADAYDVRYEEFWGYDTGYSVSRVALSDNGEYFVALCDDKILFFDKKEFKWELPAYWFYPPFPCPSPIAPDARVTDSGKVVVKGVLSPRSRIFSYRVMDSSGNTLLEYNIDFEGLKTPFGFDMSAIAKPLAYRIVLSENGKWLVVPHYDIEVSKSSGKLFEKFEGYLVLVDLESGVEKFRYKFWTAKLVLDEGTGYVVDKSEWTKLVDLVFDVTNDGRVVVYRKYSSPNPTGELLLLDAGGNIVWRNPDFPRIDLLRISGNGNFILAWQEGKLFAIDGNDGKILWDYGIRSIEKIIFSSDGRRALVAFPRGGVLYGCNRVYMFDKDERVVWKFVLEDKTHGTAITDIESTDGFDEIYITTARGQIICLDENGQKVWEAEIQNFKPLEISKDGRTVLALYAKDTNEVHVFERVVKTATTTQVTQTTTVSSSSNKVSRTPGFEVSSALAALAAASIALRFGKRV